MTWAATPLKTRSQEAAPVHRQSIPHGEVEASWPSSSTGQHQTKLEENALVGLVTLIYVAESGQTEVQGLYEPLMLWLYMLSPRSSPSLQRKSRNLMPLNMYTIAKPGQKQPASFLRKIKVELWRAGTILLGIQDLIPASLTCVGQTLVTDWVFQRKGWEPLSCIFHVTSYAMMALSLKWCFSSSLVSLDLKKNAITFGSVSLEFAFISLKMFAGVKTGSNGSTWGICGETSRSGSAFCLV